MKKNFLLVAVAAAIVVGCTNELLDTSYEKVISEAQLKGEHPLVFNTYMGNGMTQTRSLFEGSNYIDLATSASGDFYKYYGYSGGTYGSSEKLECTTKAFGVFAYYTGSDNIEDGFFAYGIDPFSPQSSEKKSIYDFYGGSCPESSYTASERFYSASDAFTKFYTPNFMFNTLVLGNVDEIYDYNPISGYYYNKNFSGGSQNKAKRVYWPVNSVTSSSSNSNPKLSFFAYYPHVNPYHPDYTSSKNPLRIIREGQSGAPILDYKVATYCDNLVAYDLMAAVPQVNKYETSGNQPSVDLNFQHILAAVYVDLHFDGGSNYDASDDNLVFYFNRLSLQGADDSGNVTGETMFRKRGLFNLATGQWFTADFEGFDLLANTWLTRSFYWNGTKGKAVPGFSPYESSCRYSLFASDAYVPSGSGEPGFNYSSDNFNPANATTLSDSRNVDLDPNYYNQKGKGYLLIIPQSGQKKLKLAYNYTFKNGSYIEDVDKEQDIDLRILPGHIYHISLDIALREMNVKTSVNVYSWQWGMPQPQP